MATQGGIQLLPATRKEVKVKKPFQIREFILPIGAAVVVLGLYFGATFYKESLLSSLASIDQEILGIENSRNKQTEKNILALNGQLSAVNPLLSGHILWSRGFGKLQSIIHPQVQVKSLIVDTEAGKIDIQGTAANYITVAKQTAAFFSEESFTNVNLGKVSLLQTDEVEFSVQLNFDKNKLLK